MSTTMTKKEIAAKLTTLAQQDESFKQDLINNPRAALEQAGLDFIPTDTQIVVAETHNEQELSDNELDDVSGGKIGVSITITF